eukprot:COSAG05_NODE_1687_length_4280_cov_15.580244_8_plen_73_part_00
MKTVQRSARQQIDSEKYSTTMELAMRQPLSSAMTRLEQAISDLHDLYFLGRFCKPTPICLHGCVRMTPPSEF